MRDPFMIRLLREIMRGFRIFGEQHYHPPASCLGNPVQVFWTLDEPPSGHPERLRPDVPLTPVERAMERQL
jgi:hypothetical protein